MEIAEYVEPMDKSRQPAVAIDYSNTVRFQHTLQIRRYHSVAGKLINMEVNCFNHDAFIIGGSQSRPAFVPGVYEIRWSVAPTFIELFGTAL